MPAEEQSNHLPENRMVSLTVKSAGDRNRGRRRQAPTGCAILLVNATPGGGISSTCMSRSPLFCGLVEVAQIWAEAKALDADLERGAVALEKVLQ